MWPPGTPNPGSRAATDAGCLCAVLDNNHGEWPPLGADGWYITVGCPLHHPQPGNEDAPQGQPHPQQPMRAYTFYAAGGGRVTITDEAILMSPMLFKQIRWARADVAAVSVQPLPRNRCEVAVTRRDGMMRKYRQVRAAAAEVQSAFVVRGYGNPG
jgi:hypothetical protein